MSKTDVIIIGGGLAGLACGVKLAERGVNFQILEATDRVGGRVRTDQVDGFLLDHGFQVLLTAYPAAQELLDYDSLDLCPFESGALVRKGDTFTSLDDPWRSPGKLLSTAISPVGSLADKIRIGLLRHNLSKVEIEEIYEHVQQPTKHRLYGLGFSDEFVDQFLRPWLGGVFLDHELNTSSRVMEFVYKMFSLGEVAVPSGGMHQMPLQLASRLPAGALSLEATVEKLELANDRGARRVQMTDGSQLEAKEVVIATEASAAQRLLNSEATTKWQGVHCLYFSSDQPPLNTKKLVLPGDDSGVINSFCEISSVASGYAPEGKALISVSVLNDVAQTKQIVDRTQDASMSLEPAVRSQLQGWFGNHVSEWELLKMFSIPYALPAQTIDRMQNVVRPVDGKDQPIVCGDHLETSSIQGALNSGTRAAAAVCGRLFA